MSFEVNAGALIMVASSTTSICMRHHKTQETHLAKTNIFTFLYFPAHVLKGADDTSPRFIIKYLSLNLLKYVRASHYLEIRSNESIQMLSKILFFTKRICY